MEEDEEDEETERARFINELRKRYGDPRVRVLNGQAGLGLYDCCSILQ